MQGEGKYIYCIIESSQERSFGPIGIGGRDVVTTAGTDDLSMLVSDSPITKYAVTRENVIAHERVVEEAMKEFTVLPVRFCTIASSSDKIRNLLERRQREFKGLLGAMDFKVELSVKALWKDMDAIFREILDENGEIVEMRRKIRDAPAKKNIHATIELGKMVEKALKLKKERESEPVMSVLKRAAIDYRTSRTRDDRMFLNAAFLVDRTREKEFDNLVDDLEEEYKDRSRFIYVGALPPYNFATITIHPEEWEK